MSPRDKVCHKMEAVDVPAQEALAKAGEGSGPPRTPGGLTWLQPTPLTSSVILFFTRSPILMSIRLRSFSSCWLALILVTTSSRSRATSSSSWKSRSLWSSRWTNLLMTFNGGFSEPTVGRKGVHERG